MEGLCQDAVGERDRFCLVWGEGVQPDVENDEGFLKCARRVRNLRVAVRKVFRRVVRCLGCVWLVFPVSGVVRLCNELWVCYIWCGTVQFD